MNLSPPLYERVIVVVLLTTSFVHEICQIIHHISRDAFLLLHPPLFTTMSSAHPPPPEEECFQTVSPSPLKDGE